MTTSSRRRRSRFHQRDPSGRLLLHIVTFRFAREGHLQRMTTVLIRGRMNQSAAMALAGTEAMTRGREPWLTDIRTVPAPRPTPTLDALCARHTAFRSFIDLVTATAGYRPSIRLDVMGADGRVLAKAYDRTQTAWGDNRRAFVTGTVPRRGAGDQNHAGQ